MEAKSPTTPTAEELGDQTPTWHGGMLDRYPLRSQSSDNTIWLMEHEGAFGTAPPVHIHNREDEVFYVIEGEIVVYINDNLHPLEAGQAIFGPRGIPHTFKVVSPTARYLSIGTPGGMDQFFRDAGNPAAELVIPPMPEGPTAKLLEASARYGIDIVGPPPA